MSRTSVALRIKEAMMQYSKKMCTRVTVFWMLYRVMNFVVLLIRPEISGALSDLCAGVDTIMIVNMSAYTTNSSLEKIAIAFTQRKTYSKSSNTGSSDEDDEDENEEGEGGENG